MELQIVILTGEKREKISELVNIERERSMMYLIITADRVDWKLDRVHLYILYTFGRVYSEINAVSHRGKNVAPFNYFAVLSL